MISIVASESIVKTIRITISHGKRQLLIYDLFVYLIC